MNSDLSDLLGDYSPSNNSGDKQATAEIILLGKIFLNAMLDPVNTALVEAGASLHWLVPGQKRPAAANWSKLPNQTVDDLRRSYLAKANIGIRLGEPSKIGDSYLHLIDLDIRDASKAAEAWAALLNLWPAAKGFPSVISGSGGQSRHIYFLTTRPLRKSKLAKSAGFTMVHDAAKGREVKKYDWEIDLMGTGSQAVIPPSIHPDTKQPYGWAGEPLNLASTLFLTIDPKSLTRMRVRESESASLDDTDDDDDLLAIAAAAPMELEDGEINRILAVLPADWVDDRDHWLTVGAALHHQYEGRQDGFDLWCEWSKQSEKFNAKDSARVWRSFKGRKSPVTMRSLIKAGRQDAVDPVLALNADHAAVVVGGKVRIIREKGATFDMMSPEELHKLRDNVRVKVPGTKQTEPITRAWMKHPDRRTYEGGLVFNPERTPEGAFNIWQGWAVQPDPNASCALFLDHLRTIVCGGNERDYRWLLGWMAHLVQHPDDKPGTAVVLRGTKGAGKDTVGHYLGALFPRHHVTLSQPEHLTGRFNSHMETALLLHLEEGFWAGDHRGEGVLKNLITCQTLQIERKGIEPYEIDHFARLLITSNAEWVVPATRGERRFFVLDVSDARAQDSAYFSAIMQERDNGGIAALLHFLQTYDLGGINVRQPPETAGLTQQKLAGLKNIQAWWLDRLFSGDLSGDSFDRSAAWDGNAIIISRKMLRLDYEEWFAARRWQGDILSGGELGKKLREMCKGIRDTRATEGGVREWCYTVPPLAECRAAFAEYIGGQVEWDR